MRDKSLNDIQIDSFLSVLRQQSVQIVGIDIGLVQFLVVCSCYLRHVRIETDKVLDFRPYLKLFLLVRSFCLLIFFNKS